MTIILHQRPIEATRSASTKHIVGSSSAGYPNALFLRKVRNSIWLDFTYKSLGMKGFRFFAVRNAGKLTSGSPPWP
jgi:hypothetical protein